MCYACQMWYVFHVFHVCHVIISFVCHVLASTLVWKNESNISFGWEKDLFLEYSFHQKIKENRSHGYWCGAKQCSQSCVLHC